MGQVKLSKAETDRAYKALSKGNLVRFKHPDSGYMLSEKDTKLAVKHSLDYLKLNKVTKSNANYWQCIRVVRAGLEALHE